MAHSKWNPAATGLAILNRPVTEMYGNAARVGLR